MVEMTQEEKKRNYNYKTKYGITLEDYNRILKKQGNKCAICGRDQSKFKKHLSVDHNHVTGFPRGILCTFCNFKILRHFRDNKTIARGVVKYLQKAIREDKEWSEK